VVLVAITIVVSFRRLKMRNNFLKIIFVVGFLFIIVGCKTSLSQANTLKVALLPTADSLPAYVAQAEGFFEDEGIDVEIIPISSAQERTAIIASAAADGTIETLPTVGTANRDDISIQIVSIARRPYPDSPQFRIVSSPDFVYSQPENILNTPIGLNQNTILEYIVTRITEEMGLPFDQIEFEDVKSIPIRFELLAEGQIKLAILPEPYGHAALAQGGTLIIDDTTYFDYSQSVWIFRTAVIESKSDTVKAFLRAWFKATELINQNPDSQRDLLLEVVRVPESVRDTYQMPRYPEGEITSQTEWDDAVAWMLAKGLIDDDVPYEDVVVTDYLP
jgi:NitT/TauT family transport system substrate-binding protein